MNQKIKKVNENYEVSGESENKKSDNEEQN